MKNIGEFSVGKTVYLSFNTRGTDGAPLTLTGGAISIYKRGSDTESTAGVTLTTDYDSRTGYHVIAIDTSADGTFYAAANDFAAVITTGTVDSISVVGVEVGSFSLVNRVAVLADGVAHGGTLGSSTATLALSRIVASSQTSNQPALHLQGNGSGCGLDTRGGATGHGVMSLGGGTSGFAAYLASQASGQTALYLDGSGSGAGLQISSGSGMAMIVGSFQVSGELNVGTITAAGGANDIRLGSTSIGQIQSGLSTLTQTQVTGGAYALNSSSFAFNSGLDFTTTQKAATLARVTLVDTTTTVTNQLSAATIAAAVRDVSNASPATGSLGENVQQAMIVAAEASGYSQNIIAKLGAWTGSGVNTILGAFKSLLSKTASTPSDIGGTFDASTDSTEAIRDRGDSAWITATGFATAAELAKVPKSDSNVAFNATAVAGIQNGLATSSAQTTAQNDLDILTGVDGVILAANQPNYVPATSSQAVAIKDKTDLIPASPAAVGDIPTAAANASAVWASVTRTITGGTISTVSDKTGYSLANGSITDATFTVPAESGVPSGIVGWIAGLAKSLLNINRVKRDKQAQTITTYKANGTDVWFVSAYTSNSSSDDIQAAS